jgi:hypothetical protein
MVALYRERFEHYGHGSADQAIVGLGGQVFMAKNSQDAVRTFRPYFDNAPVYGHGPSLESFMRDTPLTVGSPQQVIERTLSFADSVGDYQRRSPGPRRPALTMVLDRRILGSSHPVLRRSSGPGAHVPATRPRATLVAAGPDSPHRKVISATQNIGLPTDAQPEEVPA